MSKIDENKTLNNKNRKLSPDAIETTGEMLQDTEGESPFFIPNDKTLEHSTLDKHSIKKRRSDNGLQISEKHDGPCSA